MQKLAFVLFRYFPYGGLQRDCLKIVMACQARGARATIYTMDWEGKLPSNLDVQVYSGVGRTAVARRHDFVRYVRDETGKQDYRAVIGFNRMPGLDYYFAADTCFAEKALHHRGWWYRLTSRCRQYLDFEEAVFSASGNTRIFMLSTMQQQQYLKHYFNAARRMIQLPPGISEEHKADSDSATLRKQFREEIGVSESERVLLQVGSGFTVKGVDRSLRALSALPAELKAHTRYVLVGDDKARPVEKMAKKLGIKQMVTVLPGRDDIAVCLQGADILLHPAYSESAGYILLESIVSGLPVLTTDTCGFAEFVERSGCGMVCHSPFSQEVLNRRLEEMLQGDSLQRWRDAGIHFGKSEDLYHMHEKVAEILCGDADDND